MKNKIFLTLSLLLVVLLCLIATLFFLPASSPPSRFSEVEALKIETKLVGDPQSLFVAIRNETDKPIAIFESAFLMPGFSYMWSGKEGEKSDGAGMGIIRPWKVEFTISTQYGTFRSKSETKNNDQIITIEPNTALCWEVPVSEIVELFPLCSKGISHMTSGEVKLYLHYENFTRPPSGFKWSLNIGKWHFGTLESKPTSTTLPRFTFRRSEELKTTREVTTGQTSWSTMGTPEQPEVFISSLTRIPPWELVEFRKAYGDLTNHKRRVNFTNSISPFVLPLNDERLQ